jgi:antitoxin MazE
MVVEKGAIVLRKPADPVRTGWAEASKRVAQAGDDVLAWPDFANESDKDLRW